jgi:type IV pilus assembly protein PilF
MATLHAALGETEPARRHYQRAVRYDEGNFLARNDYGRFLCERDQVEDGIEQFRQAMDNPLNRQLQQSTYGAAACLIRAGRTAEARELLARTLRIDPNMKPALYQMAVISHDGGDHLSARGYLERFFDGGAATAAALLLAVRNELKLGAGDLVDVYAKQLRTQFPRSPELARLRELLNDHS